MQKAITIFLNSAGVLLLALASALFLIDWTSTADLVLPHDPIFLMPLNELFWIIGGMAAVMALICIFSERPTLPVFLLAWFAFDFWIYRIGLSVNGYHDLTGFLVSFTDAFGVPAKAAGVMADVLFAYLLGVGLVALWAVRCLPPPVLFQRMSCPACGVHVKFAMENLGQQLPCPHCNTTITLRKIEETLKTTCYFCKAHIEFPAHALGQKLKCPHCNKDITLKEQATTTPLT